jgi:arsenate reductase-like glutaredoxin family protein
MNIQIFGTKKCNETNKALRFFKERNIKFQFVDLNEKAMAKGELTNISKAVPMEDLIDRDGKEYKKSGMEYMVFDLEEKLLEKPLLFKTPITRNGNKATVGYKPEIWKEWK